MKQTVLYLIRGYQIAISPVLGMRCRFYPSCSNYARQSIEQKGLLRGTFSALKRLACCHPFHAGGHNPVEHEFSRK